MSSPETASTSSAGSSGSGGAGTAAGAAGAGGGGQPAASGSAGSPGGAETSVAGAAGSSAGSAGQAGSGGTAGAAGDAGGTCSPGYLLCEDFEGTAPGATPTGWTAQGMARVADDQANRGKRSLKVSPENDGQRRISHDAATVGAQHWGRVYYRVQVPTPQAFVHSTLVAFSGSGPEIGEAEFRFVDTVKQQGENAKHQFLYNVQPQNSGEFADGTSYDWTFDGQWHCAEWHVDSAEQSYAFYFDGSEEISFSNGAGNYDGSQLPDGFDEVRVGWNNYQSSPPGFTAWLDDFALDDVRVGCLP